MRKICLNAENKKLGQNALNNGGGGRKCFIVKNAYNLTHDLVLFLMMEFVVLACGSKKGKKLIGAQEQKSLKI